MARAQRPEVSVGQLFSGTVDFLWENHRNLIRSFAIPILVLLLIFFVMALLNGKPQQIASMAQMNLSWLYFFVAGLTGILPIFYVCALVNFIQTVNGQRAPSGLYKFTLGTTELLAIGSLYIGAVILTPLSTLAFGLSEFVSGMIQAPIGIGPDLFPSVTKSTFYLISFSIVVGMIGLPFAKTVRTGTFDFGQSTRVALNHGWRIAVCVFLLGLIPIAFFALWVIGVTQPISEVVEESFWFEFWILVLFETISPLIYAVPYIVIGAVIVVADNATNDQTDEPS